MMSARKFWVLCALGFGGLTLLAAWGYNGPREHQRARELGFGVCDLDAAEATLFA